LVLVAFVLLPAVDVAAGRVVRLGPGAAGAGTASVDPREVALAWQAGGAEWIHLVDLDAAFGRGDNATSLAAVIGALDVAVQLSAGSCDDTSLDRAFATGCARVVLPTTALADPAWCASVIAAHGDRVAVGLDVRAGEGADGSAHRLAARGASADGGDLWDALGRLDGDGCARYVVTDVGRDGTLRGPGVELCRAVTRATRAAVISSGGISSIGDLVRLARLATEAPNLEGAVVGAALHAGRFTVPEALAAVRPRDEAAPPAG
jgi:1-(5-phosphoribosyl)-5-[(5-phosphoribosylamino)methylideneamino] imidazole-4-carboxamide isomerase/N-(5'phosphoribosyl)anthranilate isomerase